MSLTSRLGRIERDLDEMHAEPTLVDRFIEAVLRQGQGGAFQEALRRYPRRPPGEPTIVDIV